MKTILRAALTTLALVVALAGISAPVFFEIMRPQLDYEQAAIFVETTKAEELVHEALVIQESYQSEHGKFGNTAAIRSSGISTGDMCFWAGDPFANSPDVAQENDRHWGVSLTYNGSEYFYSTPPEGANEEPNLILAGGANFSFKELCTGTQQKIVRYEPVPAFNFNIFEIFDFKAAEVKA